MAGDEAGEWPDVCEEPHLVDLGYDSVEDLTLKGPEHNGLVLDGVDDEALSRLDEAGGDVVDGGDGDDESILAGARALHLAEQLLLHRLHELRTEVPRVEHHLVIQLNVVKHFPDPSKKKRDSRRLSNQRPYILLYRQLRFVRENIRNEIFEIFRHLWKDGREHLGYFRLVRVFSFGADLPYRLEKNLKILHATMFLPKNCKPNQRGCSNSRVLCLGKKSFTECNNKPYAA